MPPNDSKFILLSVDTSGIQSYIFGSNRLRENIGASYLVKRATEDWAFDALANKEVAPRNNLAGRNSLDPSKEIVRDNLDAEVVYAGGGNFTALFCTKDAAKAFTRQLSTRVLLHAPGLRLDIHQEEFEWNAAGTGLGKAVGTLLQNLKKARQTNPASSPLLGLGVSVMCQSTALPAVYVEHYEGEEDQYVSAEIAAKLKVREEANEWLSKELHPGKGFDYPQDFDHLGRSEREQSYIAVVHADGNGMGDTIAEIGKVANNREYIRQMRRFSEQVKTISTEAVEQVLNLLQQKIEIDEADHSLKIAGSKSVAALKLKSASNGNSYLPLRPLVFGGDDTTFVCDGRLGLGLATAYLTAFEQAAKAQGLNLSACAGVSIVKSHYPFARAYQLAEDLCGEAKKFRRSLNQEGGVLDWYFSTGGLYDTLENMRQREYSNQHGSLTLRPVSLNGKGQTRSWGELKRVRAAFTEDWAEKRNKAKALRDALRDGPDAVKRFITIYGNDLPAFESFAETGWHDHRCGYFDALELMDIFIDLENKQ